jgi:hypothetical protein
LHVNVSLVAALIAIEELSFDSTKVRHSELIDDIAIANNIARCAEGLTDESYGFFWKWEDGGNGEFVEDYTVEVNDDADITRLLSDEDSEDETTDHRSGPYSRPKVGRMIFPYCISPLYDSMNDSLIICSLHILSYLGTFR